MKRKGIFALCLLASIIMFGCESTSVESSPDVPTEISRQIEFHEAIRWEELGLRERISRQIELDEAIRQGNMRKVAKLIKERTPEENVVGLHYAITLCSLEAVTLFLDAGVDVNSVNGNRTPLLEACWLYPLGSNSGSNDNIQRRINRDSIVKLLLEKGADVNAVDRDGKSALRYAVTEGRWDNTDLVRLLIQYGAEVNDRYNEKYKVGTLLYIAQIENKDAGIAKILRDAGAKLSEKEELAIQKAVEAEKLKENLKRGSDNFYKEVIYRKGTPIKAGEEFLIDKNRIEVLDRTTSQAGYTYLVADYFAKNSALDYARSFYYGRMYLGDGTRYCFYIVSKKEMTLHNNYSYTNNATYITSVNDLKLTCIGKGKYQQNYQDVECYVFALDAEL